MEPNRIELTSISNTERQVDVLFDVFAALLAQEQYEIISDKIVQSYLDQEDNNEYQALVKAQQLYEAVADRNVSVALCLMTELYDKAADTYAHDITDGIELWIDAEGNTDLLNYIQNQNELPHKAGMRRVYEDWISFLKTKTAK